MKPFLTDEGTSQKRITLIEDDKIISDDAEVAQTLNNFFENTISLLGIKEPRWALQSSHAARINVSVAARIIFK